MKNITIIGSGSFGCALSYILSKKNNVKIWSFKEEECNLINKEHKCMYLPNLILDENIMTIVELMETLAESIRYNNQLQIVNLILIPKDNNSTSKFELSMLKYMYIL